MKDHDFMMKDPVIVLGHPGTGSSFMAQTVHSLGIDMGFPLDVALGFPLERCRYTNGNWERRSTVCLFTALARACVDKYLVFQALEELAWAYRGARWGFKHYQVLNYVEDLKNCFPSAKFIVTMRDPEETAASRIRNGLNLSLEEATRSVRAYQARALAKLEGEALFVNLCEYRDLGEKMVAKRVIRHLE